MASYSIDFEASTIVLRTRAKGLLARLAHDLEIEVSDFSAEVEIEGERWASEMRVPVRGLRVVGALRGQRVDQAILSADERKEIERRIRQEVLPVPEIQVQASGDLSSGQVRVIASAGEQQLHFPLQYETRRDGEQIASGGFQLSLRALGIQEIKAPLGAFKVDDAVEVAFWIMLEADGA